MVHYGRRVLLYIFVFGSFAAQTPAAPIKDVRPGSSQPAWKQVTRASWYGRDFEGRRTAGGTNFNPRHMTAAHRTLDLGTKVKVTELRSGRSVVVQITDRGPYLRGRGIDLSYAEVLVADAPPTAQPMVTAAWLPSASWLPKAIVE